MPRAERHWKRLLAGLGSPGLRYATRKLSHMKAYCQIEEDHGVFSTVVPPFDYTFWPEIVHPRGYVWIAQPLVDLRGKLDGMVSESLFGPTPLDLKCAVHSLELDVSIPAVDFLRFVRTHFRHAVSLVHSDKHQPAGFRWERVLPHSRLRVMGQNGIRLALHRPAGGEPSLLVSRSQQVLSSIINRLSPHKDAESVD